MGFPAPPLPHLQQLQHQRACSSHLFLHYLSVLLFVHLASLLIFLSLLPPHHHLPLVIRWVDMPTPSTFLLHHLVLLYPHHPLRHRLQHHGRESGHHLGLPRNLYLFPHSLLIFFEEEVQLLQQLEEVAQGVAVPLHH